jgi:fumarate hydratase subunit alpha
MVSIMRTIHVDQIIPAVKQMCMDSNYFIPEDVLKRIKEMQAEETTELAKDVLQQIIDNHDIAQNEHMAICQDTGFTMVFVEIGQDVHIDGGSLALAINEGVRQGYKEGYLRKSIVEDPLRRKNTGDNTPAIINYDIVSGDKLKIIIAPKGGGSENMCRVMMLRPADGDKGVKDYVVNRIKESGGNPCPPTVVGVGIGGTFEKAALIAKKALLRPIYDKHPDPYYAAMEDELLTRINALGVGPMGLGGKTTALAVKVEAYPCHIASLPLAIAVQCHASRHKEVVL